MTPPPLKTWLGGGGSIFLKNPSNFFEIGDIQKCSGGNLEMTKLIIFQAGNVHIISPLEDILILRIFEIVGVTPIFPLYSPIFSPIFPIFPPPLCTMYYTFFFPAN